MDQKIEILEIIFCHIFTKQPCKPMFLRTLNTMSAIILTRLQSLGGKNLIFDCDIKSLLLLIIISRSAPFSLSPFFHSTLSSSSLLSSPYLHQNSSLFFFFNFCPARLNSIRPSSILFSHSLLSPLSSFSIHSPAFLLTLQPKLTSSVVRASSYLIHLRISQLSFLNFFSSP